MDFPCPVSNFAPDVETDPVGDPVPVGNLGPGDHRSLKIVGIGPFELKFDVRARNRSPGLLGPFSADFG